MSTLGNNPGGSPPAGYSGKKLGVNTVNAAGPFTAGASGTLASITAYLGASAAGNIALALYADNSGLPGALLAYSGSQAAVANAYNTISSFTGTLAITSGTVYWLAILGNTTMASPGGNYAVTQTGSGTTWTIGGAFPTFDNPGLGVGSGNEGFAMYATVSAASTPGIPLPLFAGAA